MRIVVALIVLIVLMAIVLGVALVRRAERPPRFGPRAGWSLPDGPAGGDRPANLRRSGPVV